MFEDEDENLGLFGKDLLRGHGADAFLNDVANGKDGDPMLANLDNNNDLDAFLNNVANGKDGDAMLANLDNNNDLLSNLINVELPEIRLEYDEDFHSSVNELCQLLTSPVAPTNQEQENCGFLANLNDVQDGQSNKNSDGCIAVEVQYEEPNDVFSTVHQKMATDAEYNETASTSKALTNDEKVQVVTNDGQVKIILPPMPPRFYKPLEDHHERKKAFEETFGLSSMQKVDDTGDRQGKKSRESTKRSKELDQSPDEKKVRKTQNKKRTVLHDLIGLTLFNQERKPKIGGKKKNGKYVQNSFLIPVTANNASFEQVLDQESGHLVW